MALGVSVFCGTQSECISVSQPVLVSLTFRPRAELSENFSAVEVTLIRANENYRHTA